MPDAEEVKCEHCNDEGTTKVGWGNTMPCPWCRLEDFLKSHHGKQADPDDPRIAPEYHKHRVDPDKGRVELEECPVCGWITWVSFQPEHPRLAFIVGETSQCPVCAEIAARAPEVARWVLAVVKKQVSDFSEKNQLAHLALGEDAKDPRGDDVPKEVLEYLRRQYGSNAQVMITTERLERLMERHWRGELS